MDPELQKLIQLGIAKGMSDDDITLLGKEYQKRHPANVPPPDAATAGMMTPDSQQKEDDRWSNLEGAAGEGGGYHPTGQQTAAGLVGLAGLGTAAAAPVAAAETAGLFGASYGISKLPPWARVPADLALMGLGVKTPHGSKLLRTVMGKFGMAEGEEGAMPRTPVKAPMTPKSEKVTPMTREQAYEQERFDQRMDDTHGADNPVPGNGGHQKSTAPPVSMRMDMEPDFLHQDVVRYPRPKGIIRSDESTVGLAKEMNPGVTKLKSYPRPTGNTEQARALRQRANIAEGTPTKTRPKPLKPKAKVKK